ncbi:MAG TPA: VOC family protein [Polyangiaceae bacterium]|nr:VOC family protein [Polyangiaceae bacterium]
MKTTSINWFEIPVRDLDRATAFYEQVLAVALKREDFHGTPMAMFCTDVGGALVKDERRKPTADGALVYLDASGKLDECLARVVEAGGEVLTPRTDVGDPGFIALVRDTEGNTFGLHAHRR